MKIIMEEELEQIHQESRQLFLSFIQYLYGKGMNISIFMFQVLDLLESVLVFALVAPVLLLECLVPAAVLVQYCLRLEQQQLQVGRVSEIGVVRGGLVELRNVELAAHHRRKVGLLLLVRARKGLHLEGAVYYIRSVGRFFRFVALQPSIPLSTSFMGHVVAVGGFEQGVSTFSTLLAAVQAVVGLILTVGLSQRTGAFWHGLDSLLPALALAIGRISFNSLRKATLDEFSTDIKFDLFQLAHEMLAIQTLPGEGHKFYQRILLYSYFYSNSNSTLSLSLAVGYLLYFHQHYMAANFDWVKLNQQADYKFFACVVADKLRNTNFKPVWRESFLKTLLEEIKPVCTFRTYERIEKLLNEVANQKHLEEKEEEQRQKKLSNIKVKALASLKVEKHVRKHNFDDEDDSFSDDDDGEM